MIKIHLTKSPIREAIVDFKFNSPTPIDLQKLEAAHEEVKKMYPTKEVINMSSVFFSAKVGDDTPNFQRTDGKIGYRFLNATKDIVAQFRTDGFTFSKLSPYSSWEEVLEETKKLYSIYIKVAGVETVSRVATRYINVVDITNDNSAEIKKYFNFYPAVPDSIKDPMNNFLTRLSFIGEDNLMTIINQGLVIEQTPTGENTKSFLFDIDCYKQNLSLAIDNPWDELQKIKDNTNKEFFEGVTDFTIKTFK